MIDLHFSIWNPLSLIIDKDRLISKDYYLYHKELTENKGLEIQISKFNSIDYIFKFELNTNFTGSDHAGPEIILEFFGYYVCLNVRDRRHWNYDENRWQTLEETKKELDEFQTYQENQSDQLDLLNEQTTKI